MKHFSLNTLLCTIVVASIAIAPCESDDKLITQTCNKTPYPAQCVSYIKANYKSNDVKSVAGLGIIMAQDFQLKAEAPQHILLKMISAGKRPDIRFEMIACLGIIMAQGFQLKAQAPKDILSTMLSAGKRPDIRIPIIACLGTYNYLINTAIPEAIDAFKLGIPRLAQSYANMASMGVSDCERRFNGKSPITNENNITHEIALILVAIAKQL
ncbi:Cell wall / vacuolar inhibitor of fructosidase [Arachis hypogaea]|nr:Cell wall / vacuolar inhibitor of fructosidase [Arachis hypogaea]